MLGLLFLGRDIFWLVGFLCDAVFMVGWFLVVFGLGGFLDVVRFGDGFNFWGFGFCSVFCWFLCFWMLWAVVFILGRWLVWRFGFCGVFGLLSSFASLHRFNFASFYIFWGVVNSSALFLCVAYFYFFKGSWTVLAFCLVFFGCFVVFFYYFFMFLVFLSFCQLFLIFVVFSLDFL